MQIAKPVGRRAASQKYDILTALMAYGMSQHRSVQTRVMRMMALITARYNWQRDELMIGQREIARLWSVDERTVKREMAKLRGAGWLVQKRKGARGRLSVYGLDLPRILQDTQPCWPLVGEDFAERMQPGAPPEQSAGNVVPLRAVPPPDGAGEGAWAAAQAILHAEAPLIYGTWFRSMTEVEAEDGRLTLAAGSSFHATYVETHYRQLLLSAVRRADPSVRDLKILG